MNQLKFTNLIKNFKPTNKKTLIKKLGDWCKKKPSVPYSLKANRNIKTTTAVVELSLKMPSPSFLSLAELLNIVFDYVVIFPISSINLSDFCFHEDRLLH